MTAAAAFWVWLGEEVSGITPRPSARLRKDCILSKVKNNFIIDPAQVSRLLLPPVPPLKFASESERNAFLERKGEEQERMDRLLVAQGFTSNLGKSLHAKTDFYLSYALGVNRQLVFAMMDRKMVSRRVLESLAALLAELKETDSIAISNEFEDSLELFFVGVTVGTVWGKFESRTTAASFGFDPASGPIGPIG